MVQSLHMILDHFPFWRVSEVLTAGAWRQRKVALRVGLVIVLVERAHKMSNAEGIVFIHRNSQD